MGLHFVADDWSGTGSWTSRDSNAWPTTVTGSPIKQASSFSGRSEIAALGDTNFFDSYPAQASNAAHSIAQPTMIEILWKLPSTHADATVFSGSTGAGFDYIWTMQFSSNLFQSVSTLVGALNGIAINANLDALLSKYVLSTHVFDVGTNASILYINGVSVVTATYSGSFHSVNSIFIIGRSAFTPGRPLGDGSVLEIMRHQSALSQATIANRAAQFNALKGY